MAIRDSVRQFLRNLGHALVSSVHDRLTGVELRLDDVQLKLDHMTALDAESGRQAAHSVEVLNGLATDLGNLRFENQGLARQLQELALQNQELAYSDAALLQGSIHLVESFKKHQDADHGQTERLVRTETLSRKVSDELARFRAQADQSAGAQRALLESCLQRMSTLAETELVRTETLSREMSDELARSRAQADQSAGAQRALLESCLQRMSTLPEIERSSASQTELLGACLDRIDSFSAQGVQSAEGSRQASDAIVELRNQFVEVLQNDVVQQVCVETSDYGLVNPEVGLICYLYSYLPSRRVIDVGAHTGEVSETLMKAGYEVYAFEPNPSVYQELIGRLGDCGGFHPFPFAIGSRKGEMSLHLATDLSGSNVYGDVTLLSSLTKHSMPDDLRFGESIPVSTRTLADLHQAATLPGDICLLKIDTEGFDLEVIRGMGEHRYPVVAAEFWDTEIPFGKSGLPYTFDELVAEMKGYGYPWHVVLYRIWGRNRTAYYCDHPRAVPHSWGNVFFFRDYDTFAQAQKWCSAVLPRTYFKAAPAVVPARTPPLDEGSVANSGG
jgi:FkbM family methyltransferase